MLLTLNLKFFSELIFHVLFQRYFKNPQIQNFIKVHATPLKNLK